MSFLDQKYTVCLEIKKSFVLDSARTCLKIWNRVDRGRFTNRDQKGNEIGRVDPKLSTIRGADLRGTLQKTTSFSKAPPMAQLTRAVHAEICVSQHTLSWQICYHTCVWHQACNRCVLSSTGCLPAQQEKTLLSVGCGQRTRAPRHICGALCRTIYLIGACD